MTVDTLTQIVAVHLFWSIPLSHKNDPIGYDTNLQNVALNAFII